MTFTLNIFRHMHTFTHWRKTAKQYVVSICIHVHCPVSTQLNSSRIVRRSLDIRSVALNVLVWKNVYRAHCAVILMSKRHIWCNLFIYLRRKIIPVNLSQNWIFVVEISSLYLFFKLKWVKFVCSVRYLYIFNIQILNFILSAKRHFVYWGVQQQLIPN